MSEEEKGMAVIIGNNIKRLLDEEDMKQYELAEILGVSESAVGKWVLGKASPRMGTIQAIADHFGLNSSDILGENSNFSVSREKRFLMDKIKKADGKHTKAIKNRKGTFVISRSGVRVCPQAPSLKALWL